MKHTLFLLIAIAPIGIAAADKPDVRLASVHSVFVSGNNQAAEKAREVLRSEKPASP